MLLRRELCLLSETGKKFTLVSNTILGLHFALFFILVCNKKPIELNFLLLRFHRPFERTIVMQKDSSGHVGFVFKNGKITQIAKDTSAAR